MARKMNELSTHILRECEPGDEIDLDWLRARCPHLVDKTLRNRAAELSRRTNASGSTSPAVLDQLGDGRYRVRSIPGWK